ncbi:MAG: mechanosensitive ion channel family protein [Candidatus Binatia bacterium]
MIQQSVNRWLKAYRAGRQRGGLFAALLLSVLVCNGGPPRALAQGGTPATEPESRQPTGPTDKFERGVPRTAMRGYLHACRQGDFTRAAQYLNLRHLKPKDRATKGPVLAKHLKVALDRTLWVDLNALSNAPEGKTDDGLPKRRDLVGTIQTARGPVDIMIERVRRPDGVRIWKISAATVAKIPILYKEFSYGPLGELLPAPLFEIRFLEVQLWQWVGLLLLVFVAYLVSWLATMWIARIAIRLAKRSQTTLDDKVVAAVIGPLRLVVGVVVFYIGSYVLALSVPAAAFIAGVVRVLSVVAVTWVLLRLIDVFAQVVEQRFVAQRHVALTLVPLGRRTVKVFVTTLAFVAVLQNLGLNVSSLLAGLGLGGLAVALAAQKTVENLFGGVTLIADQPVRVGDFCRFGDKIGTVEDIGMRSTRVRTLDRTVVSVPNAEFSSLQIENFGQRDWIWLHPTIGLRYETTPDQLRFVLVELKKMLLAHPKVRQDPARVRFTGFGAFSLDLEIFAYILTADINEFLAIQEDILLRIMDIVDASGTGFAFPSQTIYTGKDGGLDAAKSRAAEAQVQQWRSQNALCLPNFPPERMAELQHTLDYPPRGSALRR